MFPRFRNGAPTYQVEVVATPANLDLYAGQWVSVRFPPMPEYATAKRGLARYMQIYRVAPGIEFVELAVVDGGVPDVRESDGVAPGVRTA